MTFCRPKPGHVMLPGRELCGDVVVVDIGIPDKVIAKIAPQTWVNGPGLWRLPVPGAGDHKYSRGHAVICGSAAMSGAARLAAAACHRVGAGLVTAAVPAGAEAVYFNSAPGLMVSADGIGAVLTDPRRNVVLIGPGFGVGESTREAVLEVLAAGRATVLDADALTSFADEPKTLFTAIAGSGTEVVLTPHDGEFTRLFGTGDEDRLTRARTAAETAGATILLKGSDTVIAALDGRAAVCVDLPPWLATAGSGDVLAGIITGLLAQGLPGWEAACAGAWVHGAAAREAGPRLIAEDLIENIAAAMA